MTRKRDLLFSSTARAWWIKQQQDAPKTYSFDGPNLDSLGFLKAVRDDKTVPLALREKAARYLLPYEQNTPDQYPYSPDPLSAPPTMRHYYEG